MSLPALYVAFGRSLAAQRKFANLTQSELAALVGVSRPALANIERGAQRVFLDQVISFAEALGLDSPNELIPEFSNRFSVLLNDGYDQLDASTPTAISASSALSPAEQNLVRLIAASA